MTPDELYDLFGKYGPIRQIRVGNAQETRGTAFVVYDDILDAQSAHKGLSGFNVQGRYIIALYHKEDAAARRQQLEVMKAAHGVEDVQNFTKTRIPSIIHAFHGPLCKKVKSSLKYRGKDLPFLIRHTERAHCASRVSLVVAVLIRLVVFKMGIFIQSERVFEYLLLAGIYVLASCSRLFSVVQYESVIHEFDPWFNFRSTKFLVEEGFYEFHNWFDELTWFPLGRYIGGTVYPGLMWTAALLHKILLTLNLPVDIRNICVLLAPFMASNTAVATYFLTKQAWTSGAGLFAAFFISITPGYISRSVAGSYDNEAVAIFAMVFTFYLWIKSVDTGSVSWAILCSLSYFYMVAAWGGYIFLVNLIPMHALTLMIFGRGSPRLYVAYCTWYVLGTIMSMLIPFVSFIPVSSPEHAGAFGVFGLLQLRAGVTFLHQNLTSKDFRKLVHYFVILLAGIAAMMTLLGISGTMPYLTGRFKTLLGATSNIAIVKSVSEHQPTKWLTYFLDEHFLTAFAPVGLYYCFWSISDSTIFLVLYMVFAGYFSSIMIRLMLVVTPIFCVLGAIGVSETLLSASHVLARHYMSDNKTDPSAGVTSIDGTSQAIRSKLKLSTSKKAAKVTEGIETPDECSQEEMRDYFRATQLKSVNPIVSVGILALIASMCYFFVIHCTWITFEMYSSPQVVLQARGGDGSRIIFDDFREAYGWLSHNTKPDARILSWWDYGYQITGFGNRTTIVDNNTRNNTHIAKAGYIMSSPEERAMHKIRQLDVDYLLVVFGGRVGFSSDDINKFLWMVRISGGVFPEIVEDEYYSNQGQYTICDQVSQRMKQSLMYKMCYYRFDETWTVGGRPPGFDRVRNCEIGQKNVQLKYIEEAFTSENWLVRIYRVKPDDNLGNDKWKHSVAP